MNFYLEYFRKVIVVALMAYPLLSTWRLQEGRQPLLQLRNDGSVDGWLDMIDRN